jgi:hypothetical protein
MARKRHRKRPAPPSPGRNLAVRPGGGPHTLASEKRKADRMRREIDELREEADERPSSPDSDATDA